MTIPHKKNLLDKERAEVTQHYQVSAGFTPTPKTIVMKIFASFHTFPFLIPHKKGNTRLVRGFTLVELLVTIAIISMLASIILTNVNYAREKARIARNKQVFSQLIRFGRYPETGLQKNILAGAWSFEGNADDLSGKGNNGTLQNGAQILSEDQCIDGVGGCLGLDGVNDWVSMSNNSTVAGRSVITIALWIRPWGTTIGMLLENNASISDPSIENTGSLNPLFYVANIGGASFGTLTAGNWYHLVGTVDGSRMKTYRDGALVSNVVFTSSVSSNSGTFSIGSRNGIAYFFNGLIDEVRIYSEALTAQQIQQMYAESAPMHRVAENPN